MPNTLLTIDMVTMSAVAVFKNTNWFLQAIDTQYDDSFAVSGAKIGYNLRIRLPLDYTVTTGPGLSLQDSVEQSTSLTVATQKHVDVDFTSAERGMQLDDYNERVLLPAINVLAGNIAADVMAGVDTEGGACNLVQNVVGGAMAAPTYRQVTGAKANLLKNGTTQGDWKMVLSPDTMADLVVTFGGFFNPSQEISKQYRDGQVYNVSSFTTAEDQTTINHTNGSFSAGIVSGANQTGTTITTGAITGTLNVGDIITIAGVNAVNRTTKQSWAAPRQFVVKTFANTGATSLTLYPALIPGGAGFNPVTGANAVSYQTVDVSPAANAVISLVANASSTYTKNLAFSPKAITMVTADLPLSEGLPGSASSRHNYDGISARMSTAYLPTTDQDVTRLDVLYGFLYVRPEWVCIIADVPIS